MRTNVTRIANTHGWMRKISLVLIFTMLFSTFMHQGWYSPKAGEAAPTADGRMFNSINSTTPQYNNYSAAANAFAGQTATILGAIPTWIVMKAAPNRNEMIAGYVTTTGVLYIYRWNGSSWINETSAAGGWTATVTVGGAGVNGRRFDIVYEEVSGRAVVVYSTNTNGSAGAEMAYRTWDGAAWSGATTITSARLTQAFPVNHIKLASRAGSNDLALSAADGTTTANTSQLTSFFWNSTGAGSWINEPGTAHATTLANTTTGLQSDCFDGAFETASGRYVVVFTTGTANSYRVYSGGTGGTWAAVANFNGTAASAPNQMIAVANRTLTSNQILVAWNRTAVASIFANFWNNNAPQATTQTVGTNGQTTAVNKKTIAGHWMNLSGTDYAVLVWSTSTAGTIGYSNTTNGTWAAAATWATGVASALQWMDVDVDPASKDTLLLSYSNAATDLYVKRLIITAGPTLTWSNADGGAALTATLTNQTTRNFDFAYKQHPVFSFSASNYSQAEGNAGSATVTITVNRTGNTSGTNGVTYATSDGSAKTADNDYVAATNTLTFTPGQTGQTFTVTINGDTKDEYNETVNLTLSSPTNGAELGAQSTATIAITNDDTAPTVSFDSSTTTGSELNGKAVMSVSLSVASGKRVTVTYNTANGTAVAPGDYTAVVNGTLIVNPGTVQKYVTITLINDAPTADPNENFTATLSAPINATLGATTVNTVTITEKYAATSAYCGSCHGYPQPDGARSGATGAVVGSHQSHTAVCATCHVTPATQTSADFAHRNGNIQMRPGATGIDGGYYDQDATGTFTAADETFAQRNSPITRTCITVACHGGVTTPQWGVGTMDCMGCHNIAMGTRRPVTTEFGNMWSHKRSATPTGTVTAFDCGVCHMEGAVSGGVTTGNVDLDYHGDGSIDLRDPDTGKTIEGVTFSGTPGSYTSNGVPVSFENFSRNLSVAFESDPDFGTIASIQINQCLKCHDNNGAIAVTVPGGTPLQPFGVAITGHVAPYDSNGNGNVVDVSKSFNTSNSSYHPVRGKANNSYADIDTMVAPYNQASKTAGTTNQWGDLISCWDCHAPAGASGVQTSTVTAHGAAATLRAPIRANGTTATTNLCLNCHEAAYSSTGGNHSATGGSAFNAGGNTAMNTYFTNCSYCHAYGPSGGAHLATSTARPLRGEDAHGFNDRTAGTVGSLWGTSNVRPYAFIRNILTVWSPASAPEGTPTHTCTGSSTGNPCDNNMGNSSFTPGGAY